jgi:hypothetical protein
MAAEAPTWKLTGNVNFQFYYVNQDFVGFSTGNDAPTNVSGIPATSSWTYGYTDPAGGTQVQDHGWYFGVDESELQLNVSGTADNGLNYGFKIEINANTSDGTVADEARLQFSGGWGTLQLGDEDGAEDIMNFGGENLMGATGGFDGDFDDVLIRYRDFVYAGVPTDNTGAAMSYPTIIGDTGDATKVSYFSPRFSGFQVGASLTPTPNSGDDFKSDGIWENHIGVGANYDNSFGDLRVRASAVYSGATSNLTYINDVSAWSVGGIVGWGPFSLGANYTDNGDSWTFFDDPDTSIERSYWNVAASFETGPIYLSAGYFSSNAEDSIGGEENDFSNIALTADYTMAPGLGAYAEATMIDDDQDSNDPAYSNSATIFIAGMNVSF